MTSPTHTPRLRAGTALRDCEGSAPPPPSTRSIDPAALRTRPVGAVSQLSTTCPLFSCLNIGAQSKGGFPQFPLVIRQSGASLASTAHALPSGVEHQRQAVVDDIQLGRRLCSGLPVLALAVEQPKHAGLGVGRMDTVLVTLCFSPR